MRSLTSVTLLALALGVTACSQFTVRTRQDPSQDFKTLRTFAWLPIAEAAPADQVTQDRAVDKRIRTDVEKELQAKGYTPAPDGRSADFLLNWRITSRPASEMRGDPTFAPWGTGWWSGWQGGYAVYSDDYDTGTLFLAVLDASRHQVIWLGAAEARLLPHISLERRLGRVDDAVHDVLKEFPAR
ncbi:MAG TPA: DUF4136 domain-containing protein [Candidatus Binatia bacterium]|jgi:hypothetical protein|nr:DUF4136 domain-containing protein [Candidatus Binatia bacterium]